VLHHTADDWWGEPFKLCGWQEKALSEIFGNLDEHDNRIIEMVYLEVPKKAGKTEFAAGLALLTLVSTNTPGCQVYGAAAATRQALQVYRAACKMVEQSGWLRKRLRIMRGKVVDGFITEDKIRKEYESAESEGDLTSFKRYFLNIWDQKENRALEIAKWDASAGDWKTPGLLPKLPEDTVRTLPHEFMARFFQRTCWAGVDLSMTTDLTSVVFLFPGDDDSYDVLPFFWVPEARVRKLELKLGVPLAQWIRDGYLEATPGEVIDYRFVQDRLEWGSQMFDMQEICWDPWNSRQVSVAMVDSGFKCFEVRQGYQSLSEPSKKILAAVARGKLHHGGHPVLRWNASCLATVERNDNLMFAKPEREKSTSRIDGISAITNAMARAMLGEQNVYTGVVRSVG